MVNNSEKNLLFEGRIKEIENEIVEFQLKMARSTNQSESLQKIISALLLHGKISQSQIKKLAILSKSTISTGLLNLLSIGHIKKEKIQGSREYAYYITSTYKESMNNALGSLEKEIQFLDAKLLELTKNYSQENKGFNLLSNRISEMTHTFEKYQRVIKALADETFEVDYEDTAGDLTEEDIRKIDEKFHPGIKQIEDMIIDYFLYNSVYSTINELVNQVYVYFFTRKVLTQHRLRILTGLSLGKISQIVKFLIDIEVIEKLDKKKSRDIIPAEKMRQQIYSMNSIQKSFFKSGLSSGKIYLEQKPKFEELKNELVENKADLQLLNGYKNVLEIIEIYIRLFSIFSKVEKIFMKFF